MAQNEKRTVGQDATTGAPKAPVAAQEKPAAIEEPAKFDPAVILGASGEQLAHTYALAAAKLLAIGPLQAATRVRAVRFLTLALEFLK